MAITRTYWQNLTENAVGSAAAAASPVLGASVFKLLSDVPWYVVVSAAALGALGSVLKSLAALRVPNGTASLNPNVVDLRAENIVDTDEPKGETA